MKCPHCFVTFDDQWSSKLIGRDSQATFRVLWTECSACRRMTISLAGHDEEEGRESWTVWPRGSTRPVSPEVPETYAGDFKEACAVLPESTNASAALSRRCLQSLLENEGGATKDNLVAQINEVLESGQLRSQLADNLHYVREVGNLAAHERRDRATGEVIDATKEEAEWLIEILEGLFDHYFVEPAREEKRRVEFKARIDAAKKADRELPQAESSDNPSANGSSIS